MRISITKVSVQPKIGLVFVLMECRHLKHHYFETVGIGPGVLEAVDDGEIKLIAQVLKMEDG